MLATGSFFFFFCTMIPRDTVLAPMNDYIDSFLYLKEKRK